MAKPLGGEDPEDTNEIEGLADAVEHGRDGIAIPPEFTEDTPPSTPPSAQSLASRLRHMTIGERVKLALRGNKEARILLLRDRARLITRFVLRNPRISEDEIITVVTAAAVFNAEANRRDSLSVPLVHV